MTIRPIQEKDNQAVAKIIRDVLTEFGANKPGFAWQDPEVDAMTQAYESLNREYLVAEENSRVLGGAGIAEFQCHIPACCELQKMYLLPEARGKGFGQSLMNGLITKAKEMGYSYCYLETLSSMVDAVALYKKNGFKLLDKPLGDSGHNACDEWYLLDLENLKQ